MSYASSSPSNPLADKNWRLRHSAWLLAVIFGCGLLSFIGFLYCAIRVQTRKWWTRAAVTGGLTAVCWVLMTLFVESTEDGNGSASSTDRPGPGDDIATGVVIAVWVGMVIYGFIVNREYLRWRAGHFESSAWYNQPSDAGQSAAFAPAPVQQIQPPAPAAPAPLLGVDPNTYYAPTPPTPPASQPAPAPAAPASDTGGRVDVNSADATTMSATLGLDATTAAAIVAARDQRRGFQSIDDLVVAASLQPHELLKIRAKVTFGPYVQATPPSSASEPGESNPPAEPRSGRILDY